MDQPRTDCSACPRQLMRKQRIYRNGDQRIIRAGKLLHYADAVDHNRRFDFRQEFVELDWMGGIHAADNECFERLRQQGA